MTRDLYGFYTYSKLGTGPLVDSPHYVKDFCSYIVTLL